MTTASISHTVTNDSGSVRVRLHDKLRALEKLGRHLGLFDGQQGSQDPYESAQRIKNALREMLKRTKVFNHLDIEMRNYVTPVFCKTRRLDIQLIVDPAEVFDRQYAVNKAGIHRQRLASQFLAMYFSIDRTVIGHLALALRKTCNHATPLRRLAPPLKQ